MGQTTSGGILNLVDGFGSFLRRTPTAAPVAQAEARPVKMATDSYVSSRVPAAPRPGYGHLLGNSRTR